MPSAGLKNINAATHTMIHHHKVTKKKKIYACLLSNFNKITFNSRCKSSKVLCKKPSGMDRMTAVHKTSIYSIYYKG